EVDDGEAPADGDVDAPDADALQQQPADGVEQHHDEEEGDAEADPPAARGALRQDDGADLVGDGAEGVPRGDDVAVGSPRLSLVDALGSIRHGYFVSSSGLGLRSRAR